MILRNNVISIKSIINLKYVNKIVSLLFTSEIVKPPANHGLVWAGHVRSAHGQGGWGSRRLGHRMGGARTAVGQRVSRSSQGCPHNQGQKEGPQRHDSERRIHNKPYRGEGVKEDYWVLLQAVSSQELETGANWQWLWFPEPGLGRSKGNKLGCDPVCRISVIVTEGKLSTWTGQELMWRTKAGLKVILNGWNQLSTFLWGCMKCMHLALKNQLCSCSLNGQNSCKNKGRLLVGPQTQWHQLSI